MASRRLMQCVGATSAAFGLADLVAPDRLADAFDMESTDSSRVMSHLFASRNLSLGVLALTARSQDELVRLSRCGAVMTLLDVVLVALDRRAGRLSGRAAARLVLTGISFAVVCATAAQASPDPRSRAS